MSRKMKIIIISVMVLIVIVVAGLGLVGNYFYNIALNPVTDRPFLENNPDLDAATPALQQENGAEQYEEEAKMWMETAPHEQVSIISYDGLKLQGYQYKQEQSTDKWTIVVHGYMENAHQMSVSAKKFHDQGYNVLLVDLRGHGASEGDYVGMGWHDRLDMLRWIDSIVQQDEEAQIILYGVSMGGATVMMSAGEELPANVKVIVEDCGYTSAYAEFTYQLDRLFGLPQFPIMDAANTVAKIRAGYNMKDASALKQVAKSKTPILFIHGDADTFVPYEMVQELYDAATAEKDLLIIEGAGHGGAYLAGAVYWDKIWDFTSKYIEE